MTTMDHKTVNTVPDDEWEQLDCVADPETDAGATPCERSQQIDLELDDLMEAPLCGRLTRDDLSLVELPEMDDPPCAQPQVVIFTKECCQEEITRDEGIDPEWLARGDRLSSTIKDLTGWTLLTEPDVDEIVCFPVFSDGIKTYRFGTWKILVSFHHMPGIALVDWSPESLEEDLKNAMTVQPESYDVRRIARQITEHLSPAQIRELLAVLQHYGDSS